MKTNTIETILQSFREKFTGYLPNGEHIFNVRTKPEEAEAFLSSALLRVQEETRIEVQQGQKYIFWWCELHHTSHGASKFYVCKLKSTKDVSGGLMVRAVTGHKGSIDKLKEKK